MHLDPRSYQNMQREILFADWDVPHHSPLRALRARACLFLLMRYFANVCIQMTLHSEHHLFLNGRTQTDWLSIGLTALIFCPHLIIVKKSADCWHQMYFLWLCLDQGFCGTAWTLTPHMPTTYIHTYINVFNTQIETLWSSFLCIWLLIFTAITAYLFQQSPPLCFLSLLILSRHSSFPVDLGA